MIVLLLQTAPGVATEQLRLDTYNVKLPQCPAKDLDDRLQERHHDTAATGVLRLFQPILRVDHATVSVLDDGNCLFRAPSLGLFSLTQMKYLTCYRLIYFVSLHETRLRNKSGHQLYTFIYFRREGSVHSSCNI